MLNRTTNSHKIWFNRDYNASRNILHVGCNKLLGKRLGEFSRKRNDKDSTKKISFSLEKPDSEKGNPIKEISRKTKTQISNNNQIGDENKKIKIIKLSKKVIKKIETNHNINIV